MKLLNQIKNQGFPDSTASARNNYTKFHFRCFFRAKLVYFFFCFFLGLHNLSAQTDYVTDSTAYTREQPKKAVFGKNYSAGGNFSLLFGTITLVELSPQVSTELFPRAHVGAGFSAIYFNDSYFKYSNTVFGVRGFSRIFPLSYLFIHLEHEMLVSKWGGTRRRGTTANYIGAGYRNVFGGNSGFDVLFLYNLTPDFYSPYSNPTFRIGFMIGVYQ